MLNLDALEQPVVNRRGLETWEQVSLGEIVKLKNGTSFKADDWRTSGLPIIRIQNLKDIEAPFNYFSGDLAKTVIIESGDLLFSWSGSRGTSFGPHIWRGPRGVLNQHIFKVLIKPDVFVDKDYLYFALLHLTAAIEEKSYGLAALVHVRKGDLEAVTVPRPTLAEQKAIAQVLRTLQQAKEATEKVIAATRQLKQSLTKHLFTYGPVPFDQADKVELKETEFGPVPSNWDVKPVGTICDCIVPGRTKPKRFDGPIPWITTPDLRGKIFVSESTCGLGLSPQAIKEVRAKIIPRGSVVMSCVGEFGIVVILDADAVINQQLHAFICPSSLDSYFLCHALQLQKSYMEKIAHFTTLPYLSKDKCNSVPIPIPRIDEQRAIAALLRAVNEKLLAEEKRKEAIGTTFQSFLHHLMTGKIRVPQNDTQPVAEAV